MEKIADALYSSGYPVALLGWDRTGKLPAHVAILDDVVTTGATVTELAKTLKRGGVKIVEIWAVARAGK